MLDRGRDGRNRHRDQPGAGGREPRGMVRRRPARRRGRRAVPPLQPGRTTRRDDLPPARRRGRGVPRAPGHRRHGAADLRGPSGPRGDAVGARARRDVVLPDPGSRRTGARRAGLHPEPRRAPPARRARARAPQFRPGEAGTRARARRDREHAPARHEARRLDGPARAPQPRLARAQRPRLGRPDRARAGRHRPRQLHVRERSRDRGRRLGARALR